MIEFLAYGIDLLLHAILFIFLLVYFGFVVSGLLGEMFKK